MEKNSLLAPASLPQHSLWRHHPLPTATDVAPALFWGFCWAEKTALNPMEQHHPSEKPSKQHTGQCLRFVFLMVSENCFTGFNWAYCPAARSLPEARSQIVDAVCSQSHLCEVMEKLIIEQWLSGGFASGPRCGDQHSPQKVDKHTL